MPDDDWMLGSDTVAFRDEERRWNLGRWPERLSMPEPDPEPPVPECPVCGGDGWYVGHEDSCYESGDCNCSGVQIQCECQTAKP